MARRRRTYRGYGRSRRGRGRRRFGALGLPSLSSVKGPLTEAAFGGAVGLGAALAAVAGLNKLNEARGKAGKPALGFTTDANNVTAPAMWMPFVPLAGGVVVGLAGYAATRKNPRRAMALLVGSVIGGAIVSGFQFIKAKYPATFGDYVRVRLAGYGNVLINQGALGNLVIATPNNGVAGPGLLGSSKRSMGSLGYAAMSNSARAVNGYLRARI